MHSLGGRLPGLGLVLGLKRYPLGVSWIPSDGTDLKRRLSAVKARAKFQSDSEGTSSMVAAFLGEATLERLRKSGVRLLG